MGNGSAYNTGNGECPNHTMPQKLKALNWSCRRAATLIGGNEIKCCELAHHTVGVCVCVHSLSVIRMHTPCANRKGGVRTNPSTHTRKRWGCCRCFNTGPYSSNRSVDLRRSAREHRTRSDPYLHTAVHFRWWVFNGVSVRVCGNVCVCVRTCVCVCVHHITPSNMLAQKTQQQKTWWKHRAPNTWTLTRSWITITYPKPGIGNREWIWMLRRVWKKIIGID